ncbi:MAG: DUF501 domain-containing protein [Ilumatobacteraceae bacterium]
MTNDADRRRVAELIGREPMGRFSVVVRDDDGDPVVIENQPLLDDDTPLPTRYWLVGAAVARRVAELESSGGVRSAEAAVDEGALAAAHERYATERNALIPDDHDGPRPDGGVGGTRRGVKCLHAHYAWFLAGGDDPVGAWIHRRLHCADVHVGDRVTITTPDAAIALDTTPAELEHAHLGLHDPPAPEDLTNAIAAVRDDIDDQRRTRTILATTITVSGEGGDLLARLETGHDAPGAVTINRDTLEEIFRLVATSTRAERGSEPGLSPDDADSVLVAATTAVAIARSLDIDEITLQGAR